MRNICFFGASVTHQSKGAGYFDYLNDYLPMGFWSLSRYSFPACHFNDAGFLNHGKVISSKPDYCVFEWNTTGSSLFHQDKFVSVINRLLRVNIIPVFLILPRIDTNLINDRPCELQVLDFHKKYGFPLLDLRDIQDVKSLLRDDVHTNALGAKTYAKFIAKWMSDDLLGLSFDSFNFPIPDAKDFSILEFFPVEPIAKDEFEMRFLVTGSLPDVSIEGNVGDYSPLVDVCINDGLYEKRKSIWDPWCYYERKMTISLLEYMKFSFEVGDFFKLHVSISKEAPDYAKCKKSDVVFPSDLYMNLNKFYFTDVRMIDGTFISR